MSYVSRRVIHFLAWNFRSAVYTNSSSSSASLLLGKLEKSPLMWENSEKTWGKTKKEEDDCLKKTYDFLPDGNKMIQKSTKAIVAGIQGMQSITLI